MRPERYSPDYIIVGAGSAGCVLANRLSADPDVNVLLVEAGGRDRHPLMKIPFAFLKLQFVSRLNWGYMSEPEPHADNRRLWLPRGKCLGGTSSINGMVYSRGHPGDYDEWAEMGATGWSWSDVLPYFRKSENSWRGESEYHGASGALTVTPIKIVEPLFSKTMETARRLGHTVLDDQHGVGTGEGFAPGEVTVHRGMRGSTSKRFLDPVASRPNLKVLPNALVTRVLIENRRAVGIELAEPGGKRTITAEREVILAAGAYNSPQLLLLSGVGPADELKAVGIDPVVDLPGVGRNLQEHPLTGVAYTINQPVGFERELRFDRLAAKMTRWGLGLRGPASELPVICFGFVRTEEGLNRPDIKANIYPTRLDARVWFPGIRKGRGHAMTVFNVLLRPESRGSVTLRSTDPGDAPRIRINLFEDERDLVTLRRSVRLMRDFFAAEPLSDVVQSELMPGSDVRTDAEIDAFNRKSSTVAHHASCTCAMGTGPNSVVDPELRVRGVEGLRVVDASVMPRVVGGNTNAPVIMIAEKAADLISGATKRSDVAHASAS
jgi:choline dehydrogenase-like flavoprotein